MSFVCYKHCARTFTHAFDSSVSASFRVVALTMQCYACAAAAAAYMCVFTVHRLVSATEVRCQIPMRAAGAGRVVVEFSQDGGCVGFDGLSVDVCSELFFDHFDFLEDSEQVCLV